MFLYLNTAVKEKIIVSLIKNQEPIFNIEKKVKFHQSEKILELIDKILHDNKFSLKDIKGIVVIKGPGSFTAIRVGVTVANTLAWSLNIPVLGFKLDQSVDFLKFKNKKLKLVEPFYNQAPNISKSKKPWK